MTQHYISKDRNLVTKGYKFPETENDARYSSRGQIFLLKVEQKYLESFEVWYWRKM